MSNEVKNWLARHRLPSDFHFGGYKFILGTNILSKSNTFYVEYEEVEELRVGTSVTISGYQVGSVASINLPSNKVGEVMVYPEYE